MNDPNNIIDRVLTSLNTTPTPTGLEHRVLQHLRTRTSNLTPRTWIETLQSLAAAPWARAGVALSTAAALAIIFLTRAPYSTSPNPQIKASSSPQSTADLNEQSVTASYSVVERHRRALYQPGARPQVHAAHDTEGLKARSVAAIPPTPADSLALAETQARSLPAPTLPLTADERLMQKIVRHSELPQLAELHAPDPPLTGIAPIFAGFATRSEADVPAEASDEEAPITLGNDNQ